MFYKTGVLQNFAKFIEKHLCWSHFLIKLQVISSRFIFLNNEKNFIEKESVYRHKLPPHHYILNKERITSHKTGQPRVGAKSLHSLQKQIETGSTKQTHRKQRFI